MKKILFTVLILSVCTLAYTQTSKVKKIYQLLELTGSAKVGIQVINTMLPALKQGAPNVPDKFWEEFKKEINPNELNKLVVPIYDKYYSEADIDNLIKFYNTPTGKKMISTMPSIMQESMLAGQQWAKTISDKALKKMKEKGYK